MKIKKLLSIIIAICMIMQLLPVFATEGEAQAPTGGAGTGITYLINDDFGANDDLDGWELIKNKGYQSPDDVNLVTTEEIKDADGNGTGNYALKYSVTGVDWSTDTLWFNTHISKAITRADGSAVMFEKGTDVVIEARMKQSSGVVTAEGGTTSTSGSGRSFLKYNMTDHSTAEYNFDWGTLIKNNKGTLTGTNGWASSNDETNGTYYNYVKNNDFSTKIGADEWYNAKVIISRTSEGKNIADYIITKDDGSLIGEAYDMSIDFPENSKWYYDGKTYVTENDKAAWVEDRLSTLDFRQRGENTLYIDYIKVYEEYTDVAMNVPETVKPSEAIEVSFDVPYGDVSFKDAVKLYNGANVVTTTNTIDETNKMVTLTPAGTLTESSYKIKLDTTAIPSMYVFDEGEVSATIHVTEKDYIFYDDFEIAGDFEGWFMGENTRTEGTDYTYGVENGEMYLDLLKVIDSSDIPSLRKEFTGIEYNDDQKIVIEAKIRHTGTTNAHRTQLKLNRPNKATFTEITGKEHDKNWYTIGVLRGDSYHTKGRIKASGQGDHTVTDPLLSAGDAGSLTNLANQDVYVTIEINGKNKTATAKATINGVESDTVTYTIIDEEEALANAGAPETGFTSFDSLSFVPRIQSWVDTGNKLYVDYIRAYEKVATNVRVNTIEGKTFEAGKPIEFKVTAANGEEVSNAIIDTATVSVEAEKSYKDGILTITPAEGEVEEGDTVTVTFADNDYVKYVDSTKSFTLTARGARSEGLVVNNTFDGLDLGETENAEGWYLGAVNDGTDKGTLTIVNGTTDENAEGAEGNALKFNGFHTGWANGDYSYLTREIGEGIEYAENKNVVIKARIKRATDNGRVYFVENMADDGAAAGALGNNLYNIFTIHTTTGIQPYNGLNGSGTGDMQDPAVNNFYTGGVAGKWLDIEVKIDGYNKKMTTTVYDEDENKLYIAADKSMVRSKDVVETNYGKGTTETAFKALERLGFFFRDTNDDLYIDYIKVYEQSNAKVTIDAAAMPGYDVKIKGNADIGAYINTGNNIPENITDLVDLYHGENVVEVTKTHIEGTNKVVIDPKSELQEGTYTVKFNKDAFAAQRYEIDGQTEFTVNVANGENVNMNFEDAAEGEFADASWAFDKNAEGTNRSAAIVEENGNKFLRITANGKFSTSSMDTMINYSKTLDTPFVRDMKASTVFEVKMRTSANNVRKLIKFNNPDEGDKAVNAYGEIGWNTRVAAVMNKGNLGVAYKDFRDQGDGSEQRQGNAETITTYDVEKWYTIKTIYYNSKGTASTYIYDEAGALVGSKENQPLAAWWFNFYDYNETQPQVMHSIDDITVRFRPEATIELTNDEVFDIDDIKLYNITEGKETATAKFMSGTTEVTSIDETVTKVTPTFTIQTKDAAKADYYIIAAVYEGGILKHNQFKKVTVEGATVEPLTLDEIAVDYTKTGLVIKAFVWNANMAPVCKETQINPKVNTIYMATYGNDSNMGYESTPVATLNRAVELANDAKTRGYSTSEVIVADGTYELTGQTISIGSKLTADSLTVRAENAGKAQFINGVAFEISEATLVNDTVDANAVFDRLAHQGEEAVKALKDNLYVINLNEKLPAGLKIPDMNLIGTYSYFCTLKQGDGSSAITMANGKKYNVEESTSPTSELFFKGKPLTLARYPDVDATNPYATIGEVEVLGTTTTSSSESFDLSGGNKYTKRSITRNWMNDKKNNVDYVEQNFRVDDPFTVTLDRAENWAGADQAYMFGFWVHDWATQAVAVKDIDETTGVITSKYPSHYGLKTGQRFYVYNLLEEISQPGEYFIDRKTGLMYFYKPAGAEATDEITLSLHSGAIFNITASNVTLKDLVIGASRGSAVNAKGNNVKIENCDISGTGDRAVTLSGTNSVISNCYIHDVNGGILLDGGSLDTLTPGNSKALNNTITNFSRLNKTYTAAIGVSGMGNIASYNIISDGEHLAMRLSGVDNEISYNDISKVLKEADDMGAIYYGRSWTSRDNRINFNFIHDLHSTAVGTGDSEIGGIFLDDHTADFEVYGNIFYDIDGHGVRLNKGREHKINNNIFGKLKFPVSGSESSGNANDYTTQIDDVKTLLNNDAWKNSKYALELFNEDMTDYNHDLLWSRGLEFKNNFTAASNSDTVNGTWSNENTQFTIEKNGSLTNMPTTKASITSSVTTAGGAFDFTGFNADFLKAIGIEQ